MKVIAKLLPAVVEGEVVEDVECEMQEPEACDQLEFQAALCPPGPNETLPSLRCSLFW